jgi:two-component system aerobic respiration control sensor histidine kinase ArcB
VKFTPKGENGKKGEIVVRVWHEKGDRLRFEVEDSGMGIPADELEKIFAMYYQVKDQHGGKPATGTGIGLAVSKRLAQNMGGDIQVSSTQGKGSCFTLTVTAPGVDEVGSGEEDDDDLPLPALHVLLVEDIELNVVVARSVLEKLGNSVDVAMTGQEALDMFDPDEFDLVLLDIQLPDMTGLDVARQLRSRYGKRSMPPLVALTANVLKDKREYLDAGMDDVLSKPLSVPALTAVIKQFWDTHSVWTEEPVVEAEDEMANAEEDLLDIPMLEQYLDLVGPKLIHQSLEMFEQMMPGYLAILDSNMTARDEKGITEEGHKIKGAAGSVGLRHLQQVAQQIQTSSLPAWWDNVQEWVDELKHDWRHDVQVLRDWVAKAEKES